MDKIKETEVASMVRFGRFEEARKALALIAPEEVNAACGFLYDLGGCEENICAYGFICYLIFKNESFELHETASNILEASFSYLDGAYQGAYYHGSKMTELKSTEDGYLRRYELSLYGVPSGGISDEEVHETAQKKISFNPGDQFVLRILRETSHL